MTIGSQTDQQWWVCIRHL